MILKFVAVFFSLGGALVMMELDQFTISAETFVGDLMVMVMVIFYSVYLVFSKSLGEGLGPFTVSFWMFLFAGVACSIPIPILYFFDLVPITATATIPKTTWISIFVVCFIGTTLTYLLTNWALKHTTSLVVAVYSPIELICTVVGGLFILELKLKWQQGLGAALIIAGLLIVIYVKHKEANETSKLEDTEIEAKIERKKLID